MSEMLKMLFSLSISGTLLLCLLLLLRPLYKNKLSKCWQYYIWLLVIFRFLIPITPDVSLMGELFKGAEQQMEVAKPAGQINWDGRYTAGWEEENNLTANTNLPQVNQDRKPQENKVWQRLGLIWLVTAIAMLIRRITIYQSFVKYLNAGSVMVEDIALLERLGEIAEKKHIRGRVELWTNSLISSPLLLGFFRPRIVLATKELSDTDFYYTILHELTHYKRRDMFYKWLVQIVVCVHWFNPFVYYMERKLNQACELACDEAVLNRLDNGAKRDYGDMLLRAVGLGGSYRNSAASVTLHESKKLLKGRLEAIMTFKEKAKRDFTLSVLMTSLLAVSGAAVGAYAAPVSTEAEDMAVAVVEETKILYEESMEYEMDAMHDLHVKAMDRGSAPINEWYDWTEEEDRQEWYFYYRQSCWCQDDYMFRIGWNIHESAWGNYIGEELSMADNSAMYVMFDSDGIYDFIMTDSKAMQALKKLLFRLREQKKNGKYPLEYPMVVGCEYIGNMDTELLAYDYQMEDDLSKFAAIFERLDIENQENYLEEFYVNEEIDYLSAIIKYMDSDLIRRYAEQAYEEDVISVFALLIPNLSREDIEILYRRAVYDYREDYREILLEYIELERMS